MNLKTKLSNEDKNKVQHRRCCMGDNEQQGTAFTH